MVFVVVVVTVVAVDIVVVVVDEEFDVLPFDRESLMGLVKFSVDILEVK